MLATKCVPANAECGQVSACILSLHISRWLDSCPIWSAVMSMPDSAVVLTNSCLKSVSYLQRML